MLANENKHAMEALSFHGNIPGSFKCKIAFRCKITLFFIFEETFLIVT